MTRTESNIREVATSAKRGDTLIIETAFGDERELVFAVGQDVSGETSEDTGIIWTCEGLDVTNTSDGSGGRIGWLSFHEDGTTEYTVEAGVYDVLFKDASLDEPTSTVLVENVELG